LVAARFPGLVMVAVVVPFSLGSLPPFLVKSTPAPNPARPVTPAATQAFPPPELPELPPGAPVDHLTCCCDGHRRACSLDAPLGRHSDSPVTNWRPFMICVVPGLPVLLVCRLRLDTKLKGGRWRVVVGCAQQWGPCRQSCNISSHDAVRRVSDGTASGGHDEGPPVVIPRP